MSGLFNIQQVYADMLKPTVEDPFKKYSNMGIDPLTAMIMGNMDKNMARVGLLNADQRYNRAVSQVDPNAADYDEQMMSIAQKYRPGHAPALHAAQVQANREEEDRQRKLRRDEIQDERQAARFAREKELWARDDIDYRNEQEADAAKALTAKSFMIRNGFATAEELAGKSQAEVLAMKDSFLEMEDYEYVTWKRQKERAEAELKALERTQFNEALGKISEIPEGVDKDSHLYMTHELMVAAPSPSTASAYLASRAAYEERVARQQAELERAAASSQSIKVDADVLDSASDAAFAAYVNTGAFDFATSTLGFAGKEKFTTVKKVEDFLETEANGDFNVAVSSSKGELRRIVQLGMQAGLSVDEAVAFAVTRVSGFPYEGTSFKLDETLPKSQGQQGNNGAVLGASDAAAIRSAVDADFNGGDRIQRRRSPARAINRDN